MRVRFNFLAFNHGENFIVREAEQTSTTRQESKTSGGPAPRASLRITESTTMTNAAELYECNNSYPRHGSLQKPTFPSNDTVPTHQYYTIRLCVMVSCVCKLYINTPPHLTQSCLG